MKKRSNVHNAKDQPKQLQDFIDYSIRNYDDVGRLLSNAMKIHRNIHTPKSK